MEKTGYTLPVFWIVILACAAAFLGWWVYTALETALQNELANIERTHPGYDEYRYDVDSIGHNPNELISYLTAKFDAFTPAQVQAELESMFDRQYSLTTREVVEIRTRTVTSTDPETGETTEDEEEYEYYILYVTLRNKGFGAVALENLDEEQKERYTATLSLYLQIINPIWVIVIRHLLSSVSSF